MAASKTYAACLIGIRAHLIEVEADQRSGFTATHIVGLADKACTEAKERIRSAVRNTGSGLPRGQFTLNLAPADLPKTGPGFDLAMAVAMVIRLGGVPQTSVEGMLFLGELALDGEIRPVPGALAVAQMAKEQGIPYCILPSECADEASLIDGVTLYKASHLEEVVSFLRGGIDLPVAEKKALATQKTDYPVDFSDIIGQAFAKRALEIAAAGNHNVFFSGPPGSGKTMLAKALPSVLPPLETPEILEVTNIYSASGLLTPEEPYIRKRPWRHPHHSSSAVSLVGGGSIPKPGEVTLAHRGVLFLDELPEFSREVLETLRQPLEDKMIVVSRARHRVTFPSDFLLIAAMNPCPCGFATDPEKDCVCHPSAIKRYQQKISGPLLDRFDLFVDVPRLEWKKLVGKSEERESSGQIRGRVIQTRQALTDEPFLLKSGLRQLDKESKALLESATDQFQLSTRAHTRILRVARTIAFLAGKDKIELEHLTEALQYRNTFLG